MMTRQYRYLWMLLILGAILRLYTLGSENLWLDEAFRVATVTLPFNEMMDRIYNDTHPPLYSLILHGWVKAFGISEAALRLPSVIFGILSIFVLFYIGKELFDYHIGLLAALVISFSEFHIYYSQETRSYSLLGFLTLVSFYYYLKILRSYDQKFKYYYVLSSILLIYTHIFGLFTIIAQNIFFFIAKIGKNKEISMSFIIWISLQIVLAISFIPWVAVLAHQIHKVQNKTSWIPAPTLKVLLTSFIEYAGSIPVFILCAALILFACFHYYKREQSNFKLRLPKNKYLLLGIWLLTPIILPAIISHLYIPIYKTRYAIIGIFPLYILIAKSIFYLKSCRYFPVLASALLFVSLFGLWQYYTQVNKERWKEAASFVDINAQPRDVVIFHSGFIDDAFNYYSMRNDLDKINFPVRFGDNTVTPTNIKDLLHTIKDHKRIWLILSHTQDKKDKKGLIKKSLQEHYHLVTSKDYFHITRTGHRKRLSIRVLLFTAL